MSLPLIVRYMCINCMYLVHTKRTMCSPTQVSPAGGSLRDKSVVGSLVDSLVVLSAGILVTRLLKVMVGPTGRDKEFLPAA